MGCTQENGGLHYTTYASHFKTIYLYELCLSEFVKQTKGNISDRKDIRYWKKQVTQDSHLHVR